MLEELLKDDIKLYNMVTNVFPALDNETVKDYFTRLVNEVRPYDNTTRTELNCKQCKILNELLSFLFDKTGIKLVEDDN